MKRVISLLILILLLSCSGNTDQKEEFSPDGTLKARYNINENGKKDGSYKEFDKKGNLLIRATYKKITIFHSD